MLKKLIFLLAFCISVSLVWAEEDAREILHRTQKAWEKNHKELKSYIAGGVKITRVLDKSGAIKEEASERFRLYVKGSSSKYDTLERSGDTLSMNVIFRMGETPHTFLPSELLEEGGKCDKLTEDTLGGAGVYIIEGTSKSTMSTNAKEAPKSGKSSDITAKIKCWIDKKSYRVLKTKMEIAKRFMLAVKFSLNAESSFKDVDGFWLPARELTKMELSIPVKGTQKQETETRYEHYEINAEIPDSLFKEGGENVTDKQSE